MNLKDWAEREGVAYVTARRWFASGKLPVPARKVGGLILVGEPGAVPEPGVTVVYAQVSSPAPGNGVRLGPPSRKGRLRRERASEHSVATAPFRNE